MTNSDTDGRDFEVQTETIEINYGHPDGVQAVHPETNLKQLASTPGKAVELLWKALEGSGRTSKSYYDQ